MIWTNKYPIALLIEILYTTASVIVIIQNSARRFPKPNMVLCSTCGFLPLIITRQFSANLSVRLLSFLRLESFLGVSVATTLIYKFAGIHDSNKIPRMEMWIEIPWTRHDRCGCCMHDAIGSWDSNVASIHRKWIWKALSRLVSW